LDRTLEKGAQIFYPEKESLSSVRPGAELSA